MSLRGGMRILGLGAVLVIALLLVPATGATASVTIGQLGSQTDLVPDSTGFDFVQPTVISGNSYIVTGTGTITSWSTNALTGATNRELTMKIFRKIAEPATFQVVGHDGPRVLVNPGNVNTFPANIPVQAGDILGVSAGANNPGGQFDAPGESYFSHAPALADGQSADFGSPDTCCRVNATAVFDPSNSFTLGHLARNKKKGTATEDVTVPNPGTIRVSGKGIKALAVQAAAVGGVAAPGTVGLTIRAVGKQRGKLDSLGKVTVRATITYTPTGGSPRSQTRKVTLRKKL